MSTSKEILAELQELLTFVESSQPYQAIWSTRTGGMRYAIQSFKPSFQIPREVHEIIPEFRLMLQYDFMNAVQKLIPWM